MDMSVLKIENPPLETEKEIVDRFEKVKQSFIGLGRQEAKKKRILQKCSY